MKTILLASSSLLLMMNIGSCPVSRPIQQAPAADVHDSLMMLPAAVHSVTPVQDTLSTGHSPSIDNLRNQVKAIISPRCGSCHTSSLPTAKTGALKVFDLVRADWSSTMSPHQLDSFKRRLQSLEKQEQHIVSALVNRELSLHTQ